MKKTLLFLSIIMILISLIVGMTVSASAEDVIQSGTWGDLSWTFNETTGELTIAGTGKMNDFHMSSSSAWKAYDYSIKAVTIQSNVTSIGNNAFYNCSNLTSITIPSSVTTIGNGAFRYCSNLSNITIPESIISIGESAFFDCSKLNSITIPENIRDIGWGAFLGCNNLKDVYISNIEGWLNFDGGSSYLTDYGILHIMDENNNEITDITIPNGIINIGESAFKNCKNLTSVTIPNSVTTIGRSAFYNCSSLKSITIPKNVASIDWYAFFGCNNLKDIYISNIEGWLNMDVSSSYLTNYGTLHIIDENKNEITEITIPDGITNICDDAFKNCKNLTSVTIPNSVTTIGDYAFNGCNNLNSITIENGVTTIGVGAFNYCKKLKSVTIPPSISSIGEYAFNGCDKLADVYVSNIEAWLNISFGDDYTSHPNYYGSLHILDTNGVPLTDLALPNNIENIPDYAFAKCTDLINITLSENLKNIGKRAFYCCANLKEIIISKSITSIGEDAFESCHKLEDVYVTDVRAWLNISFDSMGSHPNRYGTLHIWDANGNELTEIVIPDGITTINDYAFYNCKKATSFIIPNSVSKIGNSAFYYCEKATNITLPDSITSIGNRAFEFCKSLTTITIPNNITNIGEEAFQFCENLTSITLPNNLKTIERATFQCCYSLADIVIPDGITFIGEDAFHGCTSLKNITIPSSVKAIGGNAFAECFDLQNVYITDIGAWCSIDFQTGFWKHCSSPMTYADNLFLNGELVTNVVIPAGIKKINSLAFYKCNSLTAITLPIGLTTIDEKAFLYCKNLNTMVIPSSVKLIAENAFESCETLATIIFCGSVDEWNSISKRSDWDKNTGVYTIEYHKYQWAIKDTETHQGICEHCGNTSEIIEHHFEHGEITTPPTHLTIGVKTFTCSDCQATKTEKVAKLTEHTYSNWAKTDDQQHQKQCECGDIQYADHIWNSGEITTPSTHLTIGIKTFTCSDCQATKTEEVAKLTEHTYNNWVKTDDQQHQKQCECGDIQYADHTWNNGEITTPPTHLTIGIKTFTCSDCQATKTEEVAKLTEHTYNQMTISDIYKASDALCESKATYYFSCECGEKGTKTFESGETLGHSFTDYKANNNASYTEDGTKTAKCDRCNETDTVTDEGSALGLDQKFKDEMAALSKDASTETTYAELYSVLQTYATLSDTEKASVATEYATLQQLIENYNAKAQVANTELAEATEIAFAPIVATGFAFLAALWFLLKKKFLI